MDRVPGRPGVVVGGRVGWGAVVMDLAVAVTSQGDEHRRPVALAVRRGVHLADRSRNDLADGQRGGVLAAAGGPRPAASLAASAAATASGHGAPDPGTSDLHVELVDQLVIIASVLTAGGGGVAADLGLG